MNGKLLHLCRVAWKCRAQEKSCSWTRQNLLRHQSVSTDAIRRFAYARSPFYRRFHRGLESKPLSELPILTKAVLMENFDDLVTDRSINLADAEAFLAGGPPAALLNDRYVVLATSGSTGLRGIFLFSPAEWLTALASIIRPMQWAGIGLNPLRPQRSAMIASGTPSHYSARIGASMANRWMPSIRMDAAEPLAVIVERLNGWQPEILAAYPSVLRELAEEQIAGRLRIPVRHIGSSAEVLGSDVRRRVQEAWNIPIYNTYGATEYAPIAAECPYGRMHLFEDGACIEIADERGPVPPGAAGNRVLLTVFGRRTQPLIRYEISDMVRSVDGRCECGRPFQLIDAIEGRIEDVLTFQSPTGRVAKVHPNAFHQLLETIPAAGWQVIQVEDGLEVNVVRLRDRRALDVIGQSIRILLESEGAGTQRIDVREVPELVRGGTGKAPLVKARRTAGAAC